LIKAWRRTLVIIIGKTGPPKACISARQNPKIPVKEMNLIDAFS
jgi:hypothetical protein